MEFKTEAELCNAFIEAMPDEWTVYPETCGFDILLVHNDTGHQIGIEAKLRLNAKVLVQALPSPDYAESNGPDFRAILVPQGKKNDIAELAKHMGVTVIGIVVENRLMREIKNEKPRFGIYPDLPEFFELNPNRIEPSRWPERFDDWPDWCPIAREVLPDVVPDVPCGVPGPRMLTDWKIKAIKLIIILDKFGTVSRQDFKDLALHQSLWTSSRWLEMTGVRGHWKRCCRTPDLRKDHPKNFAEIEELIDTWLPDNRKPGPDLFN